MPTPPTSPPITWQLVQVIATRLSEITIANGYRTDIGLSVYTERTQVEQGSGPFALVTLTKTTRTGAGPKVQRTATFTVEAAIPTGVDSTNKMETAHALLADLELALNTQAESINGIRYALATDADIEESPDGLKAIAVTMTGTANYMPTFGNT